MTTINDRRTAIVQGGLPAADAAMAAARPAGATDARGGPLRDALNGAWQLVAAERKITFLRQTDNPAQNGYRLGAALINSQGPLAAALRSVLCMPPGWLAGDYHDQ